MSEQLDMGIASGEQAVGSGWTVMGPGTRRAEFESVVLDQDNRAYLVTALVSARPLAEPEASVARQAVELGDSPLLAVRRHKGSQPVVEHDAPYLGPGEHLQNLGAWALANGPPK